MEKRGKSGVILLADDDPDDILLVRQAFANSAPFFDLRCVHDGNELIDYLFHRGRYVEKHMAPRPGLILLDLNMPRKDGRLALKEIKFHPELRRIPVVILTTSKEKQDIMTSYDIGANSYITKPASFESLADTIILLKKYWFEICELPDQSR